MKVILDIQIPKFAANLKRRKVRLFIVLTLAVLGIFVAWQLFLNPSIPGGIFDRLREHHNRISFDSETWKTFPRSTNEWPYAALLPVRIRMVDDLLNHHDFHGQTREEIEKMLGPKTKTEYFSEWDLVYYLGPGRYGDAIGDSEWLVFKFDSKGLAQDYKVVHD